LTGGRTGPRSSARRRARRVARGTTETTRPGSRPPSLSTIRSACSRMRSRVTPRSRPPVERRAGSMDLRWPRRRTGWLPGLAVAWGCVGCASGPPPVVREPVSTSMFLYEPAEDEPLEHVEVRRVFDAPINEVWARYTDYVSWTRWAQLGQVRLDPPGRS